MDHKFKRIADRIEAVSAYLDAPQFVNEIAEQRHLDSGSLERAYWHAGYRSALIDALQLLTDENEQARKTDSEDDYLWVGQDGKSCH